jgi:hypothetical protein
MFFGFGLPGQAIEVTHGDIAAPQGLFFEMGDGVQLSGFVDQAAEGERDEGLGVGFGPDEALAGDFFAHDRGFEFPSAMEITMGPSGEIEQGFFGIVVGMVERFELGAARFEDIDFPGRGGGLNSLGVQAVAAAVAGGFLFAGGGDGSAGSGSVAAGGFDLFRSSWFRSSHCGFSMHDRRLDSGLIFWVFLCFVFVRPEK